MTALMTSLSNPGELIKQLHPIKSCFPHIEVIQFTVIPLTFDGFVFDSASFECGTNDSKVTLGFVFEGSRRCPNISDGTDGIKICTIDPVTLEYNNIWLYCVARREGIIVGRTERAYIYIRGKH